MASNILNSNNTNFEHAYSTGGVGTYIGTQTGTWEKELSDSEKLAAAKATIDTALTNLAVSNSTTADNILTAANGATLHGVSVAWDGANGFSKSNATSTETGSITGTLNLTLGDESDNRCSE